MPRLNLRITDKQQRIIENLTAKTGYNTSELLRMMIENADAVSFKVAVKKIDEEKQAKIDLVSELKYKNFLLRNLTNNLNQITHYINRGQVDKNILLRAFQTIEKQAEAIQEKMKNYGNN